MGNAIFRGLPAPKPFGRFKKKIARLITSWTPPHMQILGSLGSKGACLRMREIVTPRRLFFLFNGSCASLQVGPLDRSSPLLAAQMTRPRSVHILFMVSLIKIVFPIFTQKCEKLHYTLREIWRAITLAPLKVRRSCLHQTGDFRGRPI